VGRSKRKSAKWRKSSENRVNGAAWRGSEPFHISVSTWSGPARRTSRSRGRAVRTTSEARGRRRAGGRCSGPGKARLAREALRRRSGTFREGGGKHGPDNRIDRAARVVCARWWGLGLLSVAPVARAAQSPAPRRWIAFAGRPSAVPRELAVPRVRRALRLTLRSQKAVNGRGTDASRDRLRAGVRGPSPGGAQ
jgi:hypothetical protein